MAISIDYATKIIFVPRADLTLVQSTPVEVRELNLQTFKEQLGDIQDDEAGMFADTIFSYSGPTSLSGIQLAAVLEIINGYTVTFEDGQYAVNLIGLNSNVGDVVNVNQVSVRAANSAGLVQTSEIQYSSFQNGVTLDVINGIAGQVYPAGTVETPVNNLSDAVFIANRRGFDTIRLVGTYVFDPTDVVDGFIFEGRSPTKSSVSLTDSASITNCIFREMTVSGFLDGGNDVSDCIIHDLDYIDGSLLDCLLVGTVVLNGTQANFLRCASGVAGGGPGQTANIDMGGGGTDLVIRDYQGGIALSNHPVGNDSVSIDMSSGRVVFESTIASGNYVVRGVAAVEDNSTGTATVDIQVLDPQNLNRSSFTDGAVYLDATGEASQVFPVGTPIRPVSTFQDAIAIANREGLDKISVVGSWLPGISPGALTATDVLDGITLVGGSGASNVVGVPAGCSTAASGFERLIIYGTQGGLSRIVNCILGVTGLGSWLELEGRIVDSIVNTTAGATQRTAGAGTLFDNCDFVTTNDAQITFDANGKAFSFRSCTGNVIITNSTDPEQMQINMTGGYLEFDTTVTDGDFIVTGIAEVTNNATGTATVNVNGTLTPSSTDPIASDVTALTSDVANVSTQISNLPSASQNAAAVWDRQIALLTDTSTVGGFVARKLLTVAKFLALR